MDDAVLARHAESATAARHVVGGDAPLSRLGRAQARALASELARFEFDVCLTSSARRAVETAGVALKGRAVAREVVADLADISFGRFEGRPLDEYRDWVASHDPDATPTDGESRVDTLRRFSRAYRALLARPEQHVLVVAHGLTLSALMDETPRPMVAGVPYASWVRVTRDGLEAAVARVERWCQAPSW
jgi:broad specificity phosphatase PhoE